MFLIGFITALILVFVLVAWWLGIIQEAGESIYNYYLKKTGWQKFENNYPAESMNVKIKFGDQTSCWAYYTKNDKRGDVFAIPEDYKFKKKIFWKPNNK